MERYVTLRFVARLFVVSVLRVCVACAQGCIHPIFARLFSHPFSNVMCIILHTISDD